MNRMKHDCLLVCTLFYAAVSSAVASDESDAMSRARSCMQATMNRQNAAMVACMDERAVKDFRDLMMAVFAKFESNREQLVVRSFGNEMNFAKVSKLTPQEFMKAVLDAKPASVSSPDLRLSKSEPVGAVKEGDTMHVLMRNRYGADEFVFNELLSFRKSNGQWGMLLRGDIKDTEGALRAVLTQK